MGSPILTWLLTMPVTSSIVLVGLLAQAGTTALGINAFREGRFTEARASLEKASAADPKDVAARAFLAMTKAATHDCLPAAHELTDNSDISLARMSGLAAVECNSAVNQNEAAFALMEKLETRFPDDPDVLYESARLHRKAWDSAVRALYGKAPSSYRVNQLSGEIFEAQGKYGEAAAQYSQAIEKAPRALGLHYRRGRCLLLDSSTSENLDGARAEFERELQLNPTDAIADYQIGQILSTRQQPVEAAKYYEHALLLHPEFVEALVAFGKIRSQNKQYDQAIELFKKGVKLQPDSETGHYNLMLAYRNSGLFSEALEEKKELDRLQKSPEGEFAEFLKKLGDKAPAK